MKITKVLRNATPILFLDNRMCLCLRYGELIILDVFTRQFYSVCRLEFDLKRRILSKNRICSRRFGLNEIHGIAITRNTVLLWYHRAFYLLDLKSNRIECIERNRKVLYLARISSGIYFGDYGYNPRKESKSIFRYEPESKKFRKIYTFEMGKVNHIHNIIEDSEIHRIYVFTGDFDESAAIYYTDDDFGTVQLLAGGDQTYRACVGYAGHGDIIYATDSPLEKNFLIRLYPEKGKDFLYELNGSVIYGLSTGKQLIFSTVVEPASNENDNTVNNYRYKRGQGIKDWNVHLLRYDFVSNRLECLLEVHKDFFPMMPYKFGTFRFPSNMSDDVIICKGEAVKKYDGWIIRIE